MNSNDYISYIRKWLDKRNDSICYSTKVKYEQLINNHIIPYFKQFQFDNLSEQTLEGFYIYISSKHPSLSGNNLRTIFMIINSSLNMAYIERTIETKLYIKPQLKKKKPLVKVFSTEEQQKLEQYIMKKRNKYSMAILLALYSGMRIGEICALQFNNINFQNKYVTVTQTVQRLRTKNNTKTKTRKTELMLSEPKSATSHRIIPLPDFVIDYIKNIDTDFTGDIFIMNAPQNIPLDPRILQNAYKKILSECGIPYLNFHCLRHTFATRCVTLNCDIKTLSEILEHSDIRITMEYYFHSSLEYKKQQINKLTLLS